MPVSDCTSSVRGSCWGAFGLADGTSQRIGSTGRETIEQIQRYLLDWMSDTDLSRYWQFPTGTGHDHDLITHPGAIYAGQRPPPAGYRVVHLRVDGALGDVTVAMLVHYARDHLGDDRSAEALFTQAARDRVVTAALWRQVFRLAWMPGVAVTLAMPADTVLPRWGVAPPSPPVVVRGVSGAETTAPMVAERSATWPWTLAGFVAGSTVTWYLATRK